MNIVTNEITKNLKANVEIAKNQEEYLTLPANIEKGVVAYAFELSKEDIKKIKRNKRIYLMSITFGKSMQPMNISVDPDDFEEKVQSARDIFGVNTEMDVE